MASYIFKFALCALRELFGITRDTLQPDDQAQARGVIETGGFGSESWQPFPLRCQCGVTHRSSPSIVS